MPAAKPKRKPLSPLKAALFLYHSKDVPPPEWIKKAASAPVVRKITRWLAGPESPVQFAMTHRQFARAILPLFEEEIAERSVKIPLRVMALVKRIPKSVVRSIKKVQLMPQSERRAGIRAETVPSWYTRTLPKSKRRLLLGRARFVRRVPFIRLFKGGSARGAMAANVKTPFHEAGHVLESFLFRDRELERLIQTLFENDPRAVTWFQGATGVRMSNPHEVLAETAARRIFRKAGWERYGWPYEHAPEWAKWAVEEAIKRAGGVP